MKTVLLALGTILLPASGLAQKQFSLNEVIALAQSKSPSHKIIETEKRISYFRYQSYTSSLKPNIALYGNLPTYNKQYTAVVQPNGEVNYLPLQQNVNRMGIQLNQQLLPTGGTVSFNTELTHFYNFSSKYTQYNGTPFYIEYLQPVFSYNKLKWDKRIEPLKLEESRREYLLDREDIAYRAAMLFFDVLMAQTNIDIAQSNFRETTNRYETEQKRINLGTTTEDRLLQLQILALKSKQDLEESKYSNNVAKLQLQTFLGVNPNEDYSLVPQYIVPDLQVDPEQAIEYARKNRPEYIAFERRKIESARDLKIAKTSNKQITIDLSYGLNRASEQIREIYNDSKAQQRFSISINVPLVDFGKTRAGYRTAKAIEQLTEYNNTIGDANIKTEITTLVNNITLLKGKLSLARTTDSLSKARYLLADKLFQVGKLSVTDLNNAQLEKDGAIRNYLSALKDYWGAYYLLRKQTLFDFEKAEKLN